MAPYIPVRALIFDLGDVLFQWSRSTKTAISPNTMKKILSSSPWQDYECGRLTQAACYAHVARQFCVDVSQVSEAFEQARASLHPDFTTLNFLKNVRSRSALKIYAMSNVATEDFAALGDQMDPDLFDRVFTSGSCGMRKPEPGFYHKVLCEIGIKAEEVVFVDDKTENVDAARRLGIRSLLFQEGTVESLEQLLFGPTTMGYEWLYKNGRDFASVTDSGVRVGDNFAKLLIVEATQDMWVISMRTQHIPLVADPSR